MVQNLRYRSNFGRARAESNAAVLKGLPLPPSDLSPTEFSWYRQALGGVALLWRIKKARALHGHPWVKNMIAYYRPRTLAILDKVPERLVDYASTWRRLIDRF
jgi:hypothetical protein